MKVLLCFLIAIQVSLQACLEQQATVQIQNYDGPIYLHPPSCDRNQETYECTCTKQPTYNTDSVPTYVPGTLQPNCATNIYNTGTYLGQYYPQTVDQKYCPIDVKKSCPKKVELDTNLMYGLPQNYQNRQCEFKFAGYY